MQSNHRRVIKSEEIKLVNPDVPPSSVNGGQKSHQPSVGKMDVDPDYIKKACAKEIAHAEAQAFKKGLADGLKKGKEQQKLEAAQTVQTLTVLIQELNDLRQNILEKAESQILELALAVAQKVIHTEVSTRREIIQGVLKDAIRSIVDRDNMKIHVHPQDFQYMMEIKADFLSSFDGVKNIVFEEDEAIRRGGAVVETLFGEVDARIDQQFNEIKTLFTSSSK
jgi:flagellar assembly protein FliH